MAIYQMTKEQLLPLKVTKFGTEGLYERKDLQRLLRERIDVLDENLMVLAEEFGDWADSNRRIDLLCLDRDANLVVVELKRTEDGGHMELQALRYAAMVSPMTFSQAVGCLARSRSCSSPDTDGARKSILEFLEWDQPDDELFGNDVRIILAAADFGKELTTAVIWLNQQGLSIRAIRLKPYRMEGGPVLLDVQQIIPLPEAQEYQTQLESKKKEEQAHRAERYSVRLNFWTALLDYARTKTQLHANRSPTEGNVVSGSIGRAGFHLNYILRQENSHVELWIALGAGREEDNMKAFSALQLKQNEIESAFGGALEWQELPESAGCRIRKVVNGGYRSPEGQWPEIDSQLVDAMIRLDHAIRPHVQGLSF